jgi:N-acetylmuramoyl-L-alanine amidase
MRKESLLSGGLFIIVATTLLVSSLEWKQNKSSVQIESRRQRAYEIYYSQPTISELAPTPESGDNIVNSATPTPTPIGKSVKSKDTSSSVKDKKEVKNEYNFTKDEVSILERVVEAEATDQNKESKMNVCSVIINRVKDDDFPDTVKEVVFQKRQFSPIQDGRYYKVNVSKSTKEAVREVIKDGVINEALFFCNEKDVKSLTAQKWFRSLTFLFKDSAGHSFFK